MSKIVVSTFVSLDGVMQAPGGPEEDPESGFELGGWSFNYWDDLMGQTMREFLATPFDLLLGRKTYEIFAAFWPTAPEEMDGAPLNNATKYVVSTTLDRADWATSILIKENVVERIKELKQREGRDLQVHGSSNLLQTLIANDLVDEYNVWVFPVVLGSGKRLFGDGAIPAGLKLVDTKVATTGVIISKYVPAEPIVPGSFALEESPAN